MAEAEDIVIIDESNCQCGRHPVLEERGQKSEDPYRPKPAVKPKRFSRQASDSLPPKEEPDSCKCHNKKASDVWMGPPLPFKYAKPSFNGCGTVLGEKTELRHNNDCSNLPLPVPPMKPSNIPIPPPPPPPPFHPKMPAPVTIMPPLAHRFNTSRRRRSDSIDSYDSSSDDSVVVSRRRRGRGGKRGSKSFPFVELSNHREMSDLILSGLKDRGYGIPVENGSCSALFHPFNRRVYVNSISFSAIELKKYFWLLKLAEPELWYPWPSKQNVAQMTALGDAGCQAFAPIDVQPKALSVPRICLGQSLLEAAGSDVECDCVDEKDDKCFICDGVRKPSITKPDLRFCSIQQSEEVLPIYNRLKDPRDVESHTMPIYRVVVTGSWDAANSQAFYDAGANGWSTLFTCVVTESVGEKMGEIKGSETFEKVDRLWKLTTMNSTNPGNRIFY